MDKRVSNLSESLLGIQSGMVLLVGGFGLCGIPDKLIEALSALPVDNLTCVSNNAGVGNFGLGLCLQKKQLKKMIASYVGENPLFEQQMLSGELEVELLPQGTLAESIRAAQAGIPAFFTPAGVGTSVAEGKEVRWFDGKAYLLEHAIRGDFALIRAEVADTHGNLKYRKTARNFNSMMAGAAKITVVQVEKIVPAGTLDADEIHTPGIYVDRIIEVAPEKRIEQIITREEACH